MKRYRGDRTTNGTRVTVDAAALDHHMDIASYSGQGFEWSYQGAEPRQLALALLIDHLGADSGPNCERAKKLSEPFMQRVTSRLEKSWELTSEDIASAIAAIES